MFRESIFYWPNMRSCPSDVNHNAILHPWKKAAPRMLFVMPDVNVSTGKRRASSKLKDIKQEVEPGYVTITNSPINYVFFVKKDCSWLNL